MFTYLCCDGPLNGEGVELEREIPVGTTVEINTMKRSDWISDELIDQINDQRYTCVEWFTGEQVLVWTKGEASIEEFEATADEWDVKWDFPTSVMQSLGHSASSEQTIAAREARQRQPNFKPPKVRYLTDIIREAVMDAEVR